jgi:hypothetical protein
MTPKEKAEELVIKMYQPLLASKEAEKGKEHLYYQYKAAKQCALICVQEIQSRIVNHPMDWGASSLYWGQVKQEIEKL